MKKLIVILIAIFTVMSIFASMKVFSSVAAKKEQKIIKWKIEGGASYSVLNNDKIKTMKTRFFVTKYFDKGGKRVVADRVVLFCNDQYFDLIPEALTTCFINPSSVAKVNILPENARNGAEGFVEIALN